MESIAGKGSAQSVFGKHGGNMAEANTVTEQHGSGAGSRPLSGSGRGGASWSPSVRRGGNDQEGLMGNEAPTALRENGVPVTGPGKGPAASPNYAPVKGGKGTNNSRFDMSPQSEQADCKPKVDQVQKLN